MCVTPVQPFVVYFNQLLGAAHIQSQSKTFSIFSDFFLFLHLLSSFQTAAVSHNDLKAG